MPHMLTQVHQLYVPCGSEAQRQISEASHHPPSKGQERSILIKRAVEVMLSGSTDSLSVKGQGQQYQSEEQLSVNCHLWLLPICIPNHMYIHSILSFTDSSYTGTPHLRAPSLWICRVKSGCLITKFHLYTTNTNKAFPNVLMNNCRFH